MERLNNEFQIERNVFILTEPCDNTKPYGRVVANAVLGSIEITKNW